MKNICVITGGGSGMGLAAANILGKDYHLVISGRTLAKLEGASQALEAKGYEVTAVACDVSKWEYVDKLAEHAQQLGQIKVVVHAAGISPNMGDVESIININVLGTVNVNEVFLHRIAEQGCLINISSMGAYIAPKILLPRRAYKLVDKDQERFLNKLISRSKVLPGEFRSGLAYAISKNFVSWYSEYMAEQFGEKGARVLAISPGAFETDMGEVEREGAEKFAQYCAIKRFGYVEEVGQLIAFCADPRLGYLTGVDIICDGGCLAKYKQFVRSHIGLTHHLK